MSNRKLFKDVAGNKFYLRVSYFGMHSFEMCALSPRQLCRLCGNTLYRRNYCFDVSHDVSSLPYTDQIVRVSWHISSVYSHLS